MTIMVPQSGVPWIDRNGDPYSGAKAFFYEAGTTTPKTVYKGADKDQPHDFPILANGSGMFPAVFVDGASYRLRIETASGEVLWDVDGVSIPQITDGGGGGGGDTPEELLFQTGDYKLRHGTGTHTGWVRANGRTIGSASSGATERANADCEDLFVYLWDADTTLAVSGGRGANAASDWAANKAIALPDWRLRSPIGMASMGASASTLIPAADFDGGENGDTLGATVGAGSITLTIDQMPAHDHEAETDSKGDHKHEVPVVFNGAWESQSNNRNRLSYGPTYSGSVNETFNNMAPTGAHDHAVTVEEVGGGQPHNNVQPSIAVHVYIKL